MGYTDPSLEDIVRWSKNQVGDLQQQLDCGARAFDLRGACRDDGVVRIHHGIFVINVPLQRALQDLITWAGTHPDELLLVQYQQYLPDTEECRREVGNVSESLGLMKSFGGSGMPCDELRGLTVGDAKRLGRLANGGHVFVFEAGNCTLGRGDVECYTKESDGDALSYEPCFADGHGPSVKVKEMVDTLIELFSDAPPEDGRITTTAAHWQYDFNQFNGITEHHSSLLMDEYFSNLHYWIAAKMDEMEHIGLLGLDNVCDRGLLIYDKLLRRIDDHLSSLDRSAIHYFPYDRRMSSDPPDYHNTLESSDLSRGLRGGDGRLIPGHVDGEANRLTRNRESARESRKRKKIYLEMLEDKVQKLSTEVNRMKEYAATGLSLESLDQETKNNVNQLRAAVSSGNTTSVELFSLVDTLLVRLGSNGVERRVGIEKDLEQLTELFISPVNMLLFWLNERRLGPFSYGSGNNRTTETTVSAEGRQPTALEANNAHANEVKRDWTQLEGQLGLSGEQKAQLQQIEEMLTQEKQQTLSCLRAIEHMKRALSIRAYSMQKCVENLRGMLSPVQAAKVVSWLYDQASSKEDMQQIEQELFPGITMASSAHSATQQSIHREQTMQTARDNMLGTTSPGSPGSDNLENGSVSSSSDVAQFGS
ncbi:hypothetical protein FOL47_001973 [Perkinsus chesapeaki]|uniref:BZIP domain-containing protein n=1 Tax=Perkinsus chesapeaki TaxID=330153 RepID=A0A7J6N1A7_PERCH|nr:hypothetical protein FOL47_001973 [Perkinsus chesapeaki]